MGPCAQGTPSLRAAANSLPPWLCSSTPPPGSLHCSGGWEGSLWGISHGQSLPLVKFCLQLLGLSFLSCKRRSGAPYLPRLLGSWWMECDLGLRKCFETGNGLCWDPTASPLGDPPAQPTPALQLPYQPLWVRPGSSLRFGALAHYSAFSSEGCWWS